MGRWQRLMDYCDGKEPYSGDAYSDVSLEHLRTDIIALNDEANCLRARIADLEREKGELQKDKASAITMLAEWCAAIDDNGGSWDEWDEFYKNASFRPCRLRAELDEAIARAKEVA